MNNLEFWNSIKNYDEHKNANNEELVCDIMVKKGLGQTVGGYYEVANKPKYKKMIDRKEAEPSQAFHFFEYYIDDDKINRSEKKPTYNSLLCPQLMLYIAEMAGLNREILLDSLSFIEDVETKNGLVDTKKGGGYLVKIKYDNIDSYCLAFKKKIHIEEINKIIIEESSYEEIVKRVSQIR